MSTVADFASQNPDLVAEAQKTYREVLDRSARDMEFRGRLLENPHDALAEYYGEDDLSGKNIVFIENEADATVVLPAPVGADDELSEADLEAVSGGTTYLCIGIIIGLTMK